MKFILAKKLWEGGVFLGNCPEVAIACDKIAGNSPRYGWLVPVGGCCSGAVGYQLTMANPNPAATMAESIDLNTAEGILQGVWIEYDGYGALWDGETVEDFTEACNACCDADPAPSVTPRYDGTFPTAGATTATTFTIVRADNGTYNDFRKAAFDYLGQYVEGTFKRTTYTGGNSTYTMDSYQDSIFPIGADTSTETARTFDSNSLAAPTAGNHYVANATINGVAQPEISTTAMDTTALAVTAIQANATWAAWGTWSAFSASVVRLSSTTANTASIVLTIVPD